MKAKNLIYYAEHGRTCYMQMDGDFLILPEEVSEFVLQEPETGKLKRKHVSIVDMNKFCLFIYFTIVAEDSPKAIANKDGERFLEVLGDLGKRLEV